MFGVPYRRYLHIIFKIKEFRDLSSLITRSPKCSKVKTLCSYCKRQLSGVNKSIKDDDPKTRALGLEGNVKSTSFPPPSRLKCERFFPPQNLAASAPFQVHCTLSNFLPAKTETRSCENPRGSFLGCVTEAWLGDRAVLQDLLQFWPTPERP